MTKIAIPLVAEILKKNQLEAGVLRRIIEEMNLVVQNESDEPSEPAVKKQFVIIVSDADSRLPKHDFAGWVVQIPETESPATTQERILKSAYDYNATKKGRLYPCKTIGEAIEAVPGRIFKEADLWVKTKTPVLVLRTNNEIPTEVVAQ